MDRGAGWATVHGVARSRTWLIDSHTHTHPPALYVSAHMVFSFRCVPQVQGFSCLRALVSISQAIRDTHSLGNLVTLWLWNACKRLQITQCDNMMSDDITFLLLLRATHQWSYFPIFVVDNWDLCYSIFSYRNIYLWKVKEGQSTWYLVKPLSLFSYKIICTTFKTTKKKSIVD